jgi:acyl-CoA thioester hydrolase
MPAIFEYHLTVAEDEIDGQGHVNNIEYLKWMQDAAVAHSAEQGWTTQRYRALGSGWVARTHTIEYLQPAFADENIVVKTWISNFKKVTSLRKYKIVRPDDAAVLATAETNWAFIGLERYIPRRIPQELFESFDLVGPESEPD